MKVFVHHDGRQHAPCSLEDLRAAVSAGTYSTADLCWHEGMEDWATIADVLANPPPPPANHGTRTDPLAIWSLVLGILSWFCFSILTGIPAIICGHRSLGRIRKNPMLGGKGMAITGLALGYIGTAFILILLIFAVAHALTSGPGSQAIVPANSAPPAPPPSMTGIVDRTQLLPRMNQARQLHLAVVTAAIDGSMDVAPDTGWPADAGIHSVAEFKEMLVRGGYLTERDLQQIGLENLVIGNVSANDPEDTIFLKSKPTPGRPVMILRKGGDGRIYRPDEPLEGRDPPRAPAYLE